MASLAPRGWVTSSSWSHGMVPPTPFVSNLGIYSYYCFVHVGWGNWKKKSSYPVHKAPTSAGMGELRMPGKKFRARSARTLY